MYSSISKKKCKCSLECTYMPTISYEGYYMPHAPKEVLDRLEQKKKRKNAAKADLTKLRTLAKSDEGKAPKDYAELDRWFKEMQKRMTGKCMNCNGKTEAFTKHFKNSIAHILPKAYFKSVATNENNWLELCFYGNSCHTNYDNKMLDLIEMNCFDIIIQKFTKVYTFIAPDEKRRIPSILIECLKTEI